VEAEKIRGHRLLRLVPPIALVAAALSLWEAVVDIRHVPDYLLPAPSEIWRTTLSERDLLFVNTLPTLEIAVLGFSLALVAGLAIALAIHFSRAVELAFYPMVIASQAVPVLALAPILVILMGFSIFPKLVVVALICFFPITVNAVDGMKSVDRDLVNLMRTMGANRWHVLRDVELPTALPFFFSGAKIAVTFSVVGSLYGDWVGGSSGSLALVIIQAQSRFDTAVLFSAMAILTIIGVALFALLSFVEWLAMPWRRAQRFPAAGHQDPKTSDQGDERVTDGQRNRERYA